MRIVILLFVFIASHASLAGQQRMALDSKFDTKSKILKIELKNTSKEKNLVFRQEAYPYDGSGFLEIVAYDKNDSLLHSVKGTYSDDTRSVLIKIGEAKLYYRDLTSLKSISKSNQIAKIKIRFRVHDYFIGEKPAMSERYVKDMTFDWK